MDNPSVHIECYDCKARYTQGYVEGSMFPPAICGACGSERIIAACCADPHVRGGRCDNCGQWLDDAFYPYPAEDLWQVNEIQFARLLSELVAAGIPQETLDGTAESMDLEPAELQELFARAEKVWERAIKVWAKESPR